MEEEVTPESLDRFLTNNKIQLMGNWNADIVRTIKKNFSFLLTNNKADFEKYRDFAKRSYSKVVWGDDSGAKSKAFLANQLNITQKDYPCIVVTKPGMFNFYVYRNIDDPKNLERCENDIMQDKIPFVVVKYNKK